MPCLLKLPEGSSPGIVTFTNNEVLRGVAYSSNRVKAALESWTVSGEWVFGVHVQGDCSHVVDWPHYEWQKFFLWPETDASFLRGVPVPRRIPYNCINLMPDLVDGASDVLKTDWKFDLCCITRASSIKRIEFTLCLLEKLVKADTKFRAVLILPDGRLIGKSETSPENRKFIHEAFHWARRTFSSEQLKQISFLSTNTNSFGNFPLGNELMDLILRNSKFLMLNSHLEGTPRVLAEALMVGTPVIISENLRSGITKLVDRPDICVKISDDLELAWKQVQHVIQTRLKNFKVDVEAFRRLFGAQYNTDNFKDALAAVLRLDGKICQGKWFLQDLHLRLPCHGRKQQLQLAWPADEGRFFAWMKNMRNGVDPLDEDSLFLGEDQKLGWLNKLFNR